MAIELLSKEIFPKTSSFPHNGQALKFLMFNIFVI